MGSVQAAGQRGARRRRRFAWGWWWRKCAESTVHDDRRHGVTDSAPGQRADRGGDRRAQLQSEALRASVIEQRKRADSYVDQLEKKQAELKELQRKLKPKGSWL